MTEGEEKNDLCILCVCVVVRGGDKTKVHKEDGCGHGREGEEADGRGEGKAWSACLQFELYLLSTLTLNDGAGISPSALSFQDDTQDRILKQRQDRALL